MRMAAACIFVKNCWFSLTSPRRQFASPDQINIYCLISVRILSTPCLGDDSVGKGVNFFSKAVNHFFNEAVCKPRPNIFFFLDSAENAVNYFSNTVSYFSNETVCKPRPNIYRFLNFGANPIHPCFRVTDRTSSPKSSCRSGLMLAVAPPAGPRVKSR